MQSWATSCPSARTTSRLPAAAVTAPAPSTSSYCTYRAARQPQHARQHQCTTRPARSVTAVSPHTSSSTAAACSSRGPVSGRAADLRVALKPRRSVAYSSSSSILLYICGCSIDVYIHSQVATASTIMRNAMIKVDESTACCCPANRLPPLTTRARAAPACAGCATGHSGRLISFLDRARAGCAAARCRRSPPSRAPTRRRQCQTRRRRTR